MGEQQHPKTTGDDREAPPELVRPTIQRWLEWTDLDTLTESILRRIMRVACVVGSVGFLSAFINPELVHPVAFAVAAVVTVGVFWMTYLPVRARWLSLVYPWALVLLGSLELFLMGPRHDAPLLVAGGLFIAALVLGTRRLVILGGTAGLLIVAAALRSPGTMTPQVLENWTSIGSAMAAVIAPAAVGGRMLVSALARALAERQLLVEKLSQEEQALRETVTTLKSTRDQLTHAQKLELISHMAGGIAHDMNNALTAVIVRRPCCRTAPLRRESESSRPENMRRS